MSSSQNTPKNIPKNIPIYKANKFPTSQKVEIELNGGFERDTISFELNGMTVQAKSGQTIIQAAKDNGVEIPHLCYKEGLRPDGNCRACVVEIEGERVLAPSCCRNVTPDMKVKTDSERAVNSQKMVLELLKTDTSDKKFSNDNELNFWANQLSVTRGRFEQKTLKSGDNEHPAIKFNLEACIRCTRCVRACREEQGNDVLGLAKRGNDAHIIFDLDDEVAVSSCVSCGECVQACPTGALSITADTEIADKVVSSACPYCGVGCLVDYHVKDNKIIKVTGRDGPANFSKLCVKGRFGFDYVNHQHRLTQPMIRKKDSIKDPTMSDYDPDNPWVHFEPVSWEVALDKAAEGLRKVFEEKGGNGLAGFGSAKCSNEEAYAFQKLLRAGLKTNHIDHCSRLCHAASVVALLEGIGSGAVSNQVDDVALTDVALVIGSNTTGNHPVAATFMRQAQREFGTKLIVMDPRRIDLMRTADYAVQFAPDTDVALMNAMIYTIIEEGLTDDEFIKNRTENYEAIKANIVDYPPEKMAKICGVPAKTIREVARTYATAKNAMIYWGMGITQHSHGTDNARCIITLSLITGQIGRAGAGLHPLRGQNNVQGTSDLGVLPMYYPDYQKVGDRDIREKFEKAWETSLNPEVGKMMMDIFHDIEKGKITGMYIMGENPAMSDPDLNHSRKVLSILEHLVSQDIFFTETAYFADVVLPASTFAEKTGTFTNTDRRVQLARQAVTMPEGTRQDLWITTELAKRLGMDWAYEKASDVFAEMRTVMPSYAGITWEQLENEHSVTYPKRAEDLPSEPVIFKDKFPTPNGLGKLVPAVFRRAAELPDKEYPYVLITGRQLEHWHTGSMTRRAKVLDDIEPMPSVSMNAHDLARLDIAPGQLAKVFSRRGEIEANIRVDNGLRNGEIFMSFAYYEAAANTLTNPVVDPDAKIPESTVILIW
ncbi:MAG: formate dehydrogenase subunit alpha [Gammaproteobacteria bacterium]|nr:MAG: formate dehydrogenase subunit alpha [Gammaproteobacteria bacterium]